MISRDWLRCGADGAATLAVHVQPGAKRTQLAGLHGGALKIRLAAPPVEGRANAALIEFVADRLGVPRNRVTLLSGTTSRHKVLRVEGAAEASLAALAALPED